MRCFEVLCGGVGCCVRRGDGMLETVFRVGL